METLFWSTYPKFRVTTIWSRVKIGAPGEASINTQTCWERGGEIPAHSCIVVVVRHSHTRATLSTRAYSSNMKFSVRSLSLFVRRAAAARPFSTAPPHKPADHATNVLMDRFPMPDPTKPYERVANLALRAKITIEKYDQDRVSLEEVGQVMSDVAVEAAQPTLVKIVGDAMKEGSENFKAEELDGHIEKVLGAIKGVKGDLEGLKKDLTKVMTAMHHASHNQQARLSNSFVSEDGDILSHLYTPEGELPTEKYLTFGDLKKIQLFKKVEILKLYKVSSALGMSDAALCQVMGLPRPVPKADVEL
jgi:hypothetical protein